MRYRSNIECRRGAALIEGAMVLGLLFMLIFGMLDLGVAIFRQHVLSAAARHGARQASVHGSKAAVLGSWGPATVGPIAASSAGAIPTMIQPQLYGLNYADVTITVEWIDGNNKPGARVRVTVTTNYQPVVTSLFGSSPRLITAISIMPISH